MPTESRRYLPALRFPALTRFFDPLIGLAMPERRFKGALIEQAAPKPGQRILDIGYGTGTLALMLKEAESDSEVVGLDTDTDILARARSKAKEAGVELQLDEGLSTELRYPKRSFDHDRAGVGGIYPAPKRPGRPTWIRPSGRRRGCGGWRGPARQE